MPAMTAPRITHLSAFSPVLQGFQALQAGDELHYRSRQGQSQSQIEQQCRRMAVRHCGQQCYAGQCPEGM